MVAWAPLLGFGGRVAEGCLSLDFGSHLRKFKLNFVKTSAKVVLPCSTARVVGAAVGPYFANSLKATGDCVEWPWDAYPIRHNSLNYRTMAGGAPNMPLLLVEICP